MRGTTATTQKVEAPVVTPAQLETLVAVTAKQSAVRQAFQFSDLSSSAIASQNQQTGVVLGLLPHDLIGQKKIVRQTLGTMAVIAGGADSPTGYLNRMAEFIFATQSLTRLNVTLSTMSRYAFPSFSNLSNTYFFGGFAGQRRLSRTQPPINAGTDTIDRYNRSAKSITQISTKLAGPFCAFVSKAFGNLVKAIIPAAYRIPPAPGAWVTQSIDLGNGLYQYGDRQLQRFTLAGELTQVISAQLVQPRFGFCSLQGNNKTAVTLYGLNCWNANKPGNGGYDSDRDYSQGTQFDLDTETSTPISEFRGFGGSRYGASAASSKTAGYVFGGVDHTNTSTDNPPNDWVRSILEYNFSTKGGVEIAARFSLAHYFGAAVAQDSAYIMDGRGNTPSQQFNFARKDLTPLSVILVPEANFVMSWYATESDYNPGWGI